MNVAEEQSPTEATSISVIGAHIKITGNIEAIGDPHLADLQIEGTVVGDVRCATLILSEGCSINGNICADRVRVSGRVDGGIETKDLAVEASAHVSGDVLYERLRIAAGGIIQGTLKWSGVAQTEAAKLKLVASPPEPQQKPIYIE